MCAACSGARRLVAVAAAHPWTDQRGCARPRAVTRTPGPGHSNIAAPRCSSRRGRPAARQQIKLFQVRNFSTCTLNTITTPLCATRELLSGWLGDCGSLVPALVPPAAVSGDVVSVSGVKSWAVAESRHSNNQGKVPNCPDTRSTMWSDLLQQYSATT